MVMKQIRGTPLQLQKQTHSWRWKILKNVKDWPAKKEGYASSYNCRGYDNKAVYLDSEYHYGSDFGDENSDNTVLTIHFKAKPNRLKDYSLTGQ